MNSLLTGRRDLLVAAAISALLHFGLSRWSTARPTVVRAVPDSPPTVNMIPYETFPDPVEEPSPAAADHIAVNAPAQPDVPQPPRPDALSIPLEPGRPAVVTADYIIDPPGPIGPIGDSLKPAVFEPALLDHAPVARSRANPVYPFDERRRGLEGSVLVDFIVDASGTVYGARAVPPSATGFESAAVQAVSKWKFQPGMKSGRPVAVHLQIPIVFSITRDQ